FFCFFFSSRRRHTRCLSDWSSDVCSSDLSLSSWVPVVPRRFVSEDESELFDEIRRGPVLVHHPYDSFAGTFEAFMATAARDDARSEERRVGKECRCRVGTEQRNKEGGVDR